MFATQREGERVSLSNAISKAGFSTYKGLQEITNIYNEAFSSQEVT